jgi:hypothetical protein
VIAISQAALNKKKALFTSKLDLNWQKNVVFSLHLERSCTESGTLRGGTRAEIRRAFEMWSGDWLGSVVLIVWETKKSYESRRRGISCL